MKLINVISEWDSKFIILGGMQCKLDDSTSVLDKPALAA
jgi:hypothetical protein